MRFISALSFLLATAISARAQHTLGSLDSSFGIKGVVIDSFADGAPAFANDVAVQSDGKIVTIGRTINRYLPNGLPDYAFGIDGNIDLRGGKICVRSNGKILALCSGVQTVFLIQLKGSGAVDSSFGVQGRVYLASASMSTLKLMNDGSVITGAGDEYAYLNKIRPDGTLDSTFGVNGLAATYIGNYSGDVAKLDTTFDGRIVVAGIGYVQGTRSALLLRFLPNGKPDSTFGTNGKTYPFTTDFCRDMALQKDGKILASFGGFNGNSLFRFQSDGALDLAYGQGGECELPQSTAYFKLLDSGKIVCAGSDGNFVVAKLKAGGAARDSTFGINGIGVPPFDPVNKNRVYALAVQPDGKIIVAGYSRTNGTGGYRLMLTRYHDTLPRMPSAVPAVRTASPLLLYPNPAGTTLTISGIAPHLSASPYQIVTATGQIVLRGTLPQADTHTVNVSLLPAGLYYLRYPSASLPFIKQ